jgi:cob(I)alamin adenosyltransferase
MGHRLSKIYTRTGDDGSTGLGDGTRVGKDEARVAAMGAIDELTSHLGVVLTHALPTDIGNLLREIQHDLFDIGGELSIPQRCVMDAGDTARLERALDQLNVALSPLKEFILPGGTASAAACHVARAVCRRAERAAVKLLRAESINPQTL